MELGIFTRTFERPTLSAVLDAVVEHGFRVIHFNLRSAGMPTSLEHLSSKQCALIRRAIEARGLRMAGVSATYNQIHPDPERRARETRLAQGVIERAPDLGTQFVSLSTGTRDPDDMWRGHPANDDPSAWHDLLDTMAVLLVTATRAGVTLGVEPEHRNVVSSADRARRLLDEFRDQPIGIIFDAANLLTPATADHQGSILSDAFDTLAADILMVHAKDVAAEGDAAAGRGLLDYGLYFELIVKHAVPGPVIIHEVVEEDVPRARAFVLAAAAAAGVGMATD